MGVEIVPPAAPKKAAKPHERGERVRTEAEVVVFFGSERHLMALRNLSASGAVIVSDFELPETAFMRMHVRLTASSEVIELDGVPVRSTPVAEGTLTAVRFLDPPDDVVARIEAFVTARAEGD